MLPPIRNKSNFKSSIYTNRFAIILCFNVTILWILWSNTVYMQENPIDSHNLNSISEGDLLYVITPTYTRPSQIADLTAMINTLRLVPQMHWILVEDSPNKTNAVIQHLSSSGLTYTHLNKEMPRQLKEEKYCQRGNFQRNLALDLISKRGSDRSIVYFADDDNRYDTRLFNEIRKTKYISTFPVAFTGKSRYQRCYVDENTGKVAGFYTRWTFDRKFQVDMAGFAFTVKALRESQARFHIDVKCGWIETKFVEQIASSVSDLEPLCNNCTAVYVWHVRTADIQGGGQIPWTYDSIPLKNGIEKEKDLLFDTIVV